MAALQEKGDSGEYRAGPKPWDDHVRWQPGSRATERIVVIEQELSPPTEAPRHTLAKVGLTCRECEVALALLSGRGAKDMARQLTIQVRTVHKHLEHIFRKLGVHNQVAAVLALRCCLENGSSRLSWRWVFWRPPSKPLLLDP